MQRNETEHFINQGFGWLCKRCQAEETANAAAKGGRARFFSEGEAEEKEPALSSPTLARWRDGTQQTLVCPRCGLAERVKALLPASKASSKTSG